MLGNVSFNIWGPIFIHCIHGHKYFLVALDDHSKFTWVILSKSKSKVPNLVQKFLTIIETQYHIHVKTVRSDKGYEFLMSHIYESKGIEHRISCVETPKKWTCGKKTSIYLKC